MRLKCWGWVFRLSTLRFGTVVGYRGGLLKIWRWRFKVDFELVKISHLSGVLENWVMQLGREFGHHGVGVGVHFGSVVRL